MSKVLFVNLTRLCNVDCPRCYLTPQNRASKLKLPAGALSDILSSEFFQSSASAGDPPVVIFQGGEPTIVGEVSFRGYIQEVRRAVPAARMTMVTNLLSLPDWAYEVAREYFDGRIETTWAAGMKQTLSGRQDLFQQRFSDTLGKVIASGLVCPVNVELNRETYTAGPQCIVDLHRRTGARDFAVDYSVQFDRFRLAPNFGAGGYPFLPASLKNSEFQNFAFGLRRLLHIEGLQNTISCNLLYSRKKRLDDMAFNTNREADFVTINPDGTVTTNPLFSDITETYLGNINDDAFETIMMNPARVQRMGYEIDRVTSCKSCAEFNICQGGPSHLPVYDESGACVGMKEFLSGLV